MAAVWMRARAALRHRALSAVALALAVGIGGGGALLAFAGARRTDSAVARFVAYEHPAQGSVDPQDPTDDEPALLAEIGRLPEVAASEIGARLLLGASVNLNAIAAVDQSGFNRPIVAAGRLARPGQPDEAMINDQAAADLHLHVGGSLDVQGMAPADVLQALRGAVVQPSGEVAHLRIVGIIRLPVDLSLAPAPAGVDFTANDNLYLTPAFFAAHGATMGHLGLGLSWRLHRPADLPAFTRAVDQLSGGRLVAHPGSDDLAAAQQAEHATRIEALALLLFGLLAAVLTAALVGQALTRQAHLDGADYRVLQAMGYTRRQAAAAGALNAAVAGLIGAVLATGLAFATSAAMPIGLARQAEVSPGLSFNATILGLGALAIAVAVAGWAWVAAWRTARTYGAAGGRAGRPSLAERIGLTRFSPSFSIGIRMAVDPGRGASAVPVRTMVAGVVVAIAALAATVTFGVNLTRLARQPRLQGWNWDLAVGNPHADDTAAQTIPQLEADPSVSGITALAGAGGGVSAVIPGHPDMPIFGFQRVRGAVLPPFIAGRPPEAPDEIALAPKTMAALGRHVGQHVEIGMPDETRAMVVTGEVVLTSAALNDSMPLGQGALVNLSALSGLPPDEAAPVNVFLVRLAPGAGAAAVRRLQAAFPGVVLPPVAPPDLENLLRVDGLPAALALLFAGVALLTVGHTLISGVRRRRRELAILRSIGLVGRQVRAAVAWQATTVALAGVVIGLPAGVIAGRWAWGLVDSQLGLPFHAVVPLGLLALVAGATLLAANLAAAIPGALAVRTRPAEALRAE
ncbi:MAG TPA: FtsX-like permease family protein [Actinomycetota bacterium]|nr:FtsX-like permease family protein [Actinomycetota bacterium]